MLEVKTTRKAFQMAQGKVFCEDGTNLHVRVKMPRIQVRKNGHLYVKYLNPDEIDMLTQGKLSNWKDMVSFRIINFSY
jgi:hypothetical protein